MTEPAAAPVVGILLAGGAGTRFRASGGGDKLMHPLPDGTPIAVASLRNLLAAVPRVVAVVRPGSEALTAALSQAGAEVTVCPQADEGMGRTLAHAVGEAGETGGYVVALADMPFIPLAVIQEVIARVAAGAWIVAPTYRGERGHPVGFAYALRGELETLRGDAGAREVVKAHLARVQYLEAAEGAVLQDIDTVDALSGPCDSDAPP
jgi:molybdenum cofactor cytidylyltransferase